MKNLHLVVSYDGTRFHGFQRQTSHISVQSEIEEAVRKAFGCEIKLYASGRTDSGVHALRQHVSFELDTRIPPYGIRSKINHYLPKDIRVLELTEEDSQFNARYSAIRKTYMYRINLDRNRDVILRNYAWNLKEFDPKIIDLAREHFLGEHDFTSFSSFKTTKESKVRTIYSLEYVLADGQIDIYIEGNGFLYNMVRIIVAYLHKCSEGKMDISLTKEIIDSMSRERTTQVAPAQGLYLYDVKYENVE